jgi:hypothetical protein
VDCNTLNERLKDAQDAVSTMKSLTHRVDEALGSFQTATDIADDVIHVAVCPSEIHNAIAALNEAIGNAEAAMWVEFRGAQSDLDFVEYPLEGDAP